MPSIEGRRPSRSPAACRAAPSPTRFAVEPPDVNVPTKLFGNPSRSMSQRIARSSTKFAGVAHQRCGEATAWTRSATAPIVVGAVVTQPLNPGCPIRSPAATISSRRRASVRSGPMPVGGEGLVEGREPGGAAASPGRRLRTAGTARGRGGPSASDEVRWW